MPVSGKSKSICHALSLASGDTGRSVLHIFVTAQVTLLSHTMSNPSGLLGQAVLKIVEPLIEFMGILAASGDSYKVSKIHRSCMEMFNKARMAVSISSQSSISSSLSNRYGQSRGKESMHDFLQKVGKDSLRI